MSGAVVVITKSGEKLEVKKFPYVVDENIETLTDVYEDALSYFVEMVESIKNVTEEELANAMARQYFILPDKFVTITVVEH